MPPPTKSPGWLLSSSDVVWPAAVPGENRWQRNITPTTANDLRDVMATSSVPCEFGRGYSLPGTSINARYKSPVQVARLGDSRWTPVAPRFLLLPVTALVNRPQEEIEDSRCDLSPFLARRCVREAKMNPHVDATVDYVGGQS